MALSAAQGVLRGTKIGENGVARATLLRQDSRVSRASAWRGRFSNGPPLAPIRSISVYFAGVNIRRESRDLDSAPLKLTDGAYSAPSGWRFLPNSAHDRDTGPSAQSDQPTHVRLFGMASENEHTKSARRAREDRGGANIACGLEWDGARRSSGRCPFATIVGQAPVAGSVAID